MAEIIKSSSIKDAKVLLVKKPVVSDVVFNNDFELEPKGNLLDDEEATLGRMAKAKQEAKRLEGAKDFDPEKAAEDAQKLLKNAESILTDARVAYKAAVKKGEADAKAVAAKSRGEIVKLERDLRKRLRQGYNRGLCNGYEEGFVLGQKAGKQETKEQLTEVCKTLEQTCEYINNKQDEILKDYEAELVDLAFEIAEKITMKALEQDSESYAKIVEAAVAKLEKPQKVEITVPSAEVAESVLAKESLIKKAIGSIDNFKVKVSEDEQGKILVETPTEFIDATPEVQLKNIREKLKKMQRF